MVPTFLCSLPSGRCPGLKELTLSANPGITPKGWSRLAIAVAHSSQVRVLNLDYNPLGETQESPFVSHGPSRILKQWSH